ncbi:MAG TPA: hypothetical protein VGO66_07785 [Solirubrobacterales bacterium]|nr:hypothetical protein [Solirubrobacterales bacterium]
MRMRIVTALLAVVALALLIAASAGAEMIGIYRNSMESTAQRAQLLQLAGRSCTRGGSDSALRIVVGKRTEECAYRTPVIGRDLEIAATMRLLSGTPEPVQKKAFLALELRAGGGAKYQLLVFPLQQKTQLRKVLPTGEVKYLQIAKEEEAVKGVNMANGLRLRATNVTSGPEQGSCRLFAYVGPTLVAEAVDAGAGELAGRASAVAVGALKNGSGVIASVDDVVVRVPSPF